MLLLCVEDEGRILLLGDVVKWGLLVAGIVLLIAMIAELPFLEFLNLEELTSAVSSVVSLCGNAFMFARGLINNFLTPFGRVAATGLLYWVICKPFAMQAIQYLVWIYHYIFK